MPEAKKKNYIVFTSFNSNNYGNNNFLSGYVMNFSFQSYLGSVNVKTIVKL